jgi:hypothetical protein
VIALLHDVVEDTFESYCQINLADIQAEFGEYVATRVGALTRREPGMLYRSVGQGGGEWKIATEQEVYLDAYIPRVCEFSASREIKIEDLYDSLDPRRFRNMKTEEEQSRDQQYYRAIEILLASAAMTRPASLDLRDPASRLALSEESYTRSTLAVSR